MTVGSNPLYAFIAYRDAEHYYIVPNILLIGSSSNGFKTFYYTTEFDENYYPYPHSFGTQLSNT